MRLILMVLTAMVGCTPVKPYQLESLIAPLPPHSSSSRPDFCPYSELANISVESWTYEGAMAKLSKVLEEVNADGVIEFRFHYEYVSISDEQCDLLPDLCLEGSHPGWYTAKVFRMSGYAVKWRCPNGEQP